MLICAAGDIHGAIKRFYDDVLLFEVSLGVTFEWVLHVGDFGIWPDPESIDRAARNHGARPPVSILAITSRASSTGSSSAGATGPRVK